MGLQSDTLVLFNMEALRSKREVVASIEDYILHHKQQDNGEGYSEEKRAVILDICQEFFKKVQDTDIPELTNPFYCYEYSLKHDGMTLDLVHYSDVTFNEDGMMDSCTLSTVYTLVQINSVYLSVEEYAKLSGVTAVTVRQWIRRGKLRTARKIGGEWKIPSLSDPPKRGYEPATYHWKSLPAPIQISFPFLPESGSLTLYQEETDKNKFCLYLHNDLTKTADKKELELKEREKLELMLIACDDVNVELLSDRVMYVPPKRTASIPYLKQSPIDCEPASIVVSFSTSETVFFDTEDSPGSSYYDGEPDNYVLSIAWTFFSAGDEDALELSFEGDYSKCEKIGTIQGQLILNDAIREDGWDPILLCDDLEADLGFLMEEFYGEYGPLNSTYSSSCENILYIYEFFTEPNFAHSSVKDRILRELPWICKRTMHVHPGLLAYMIRDGIDTASANEIQTFYESNGFCSLNHSKLLYAYTE